jgi:thiol-disulfide isomerase/thioredoxin
MKKTLLVMPVLALLLIWGCKDKQYLVGYYNYASFQKECRWDHFTDEKYKPNAKWLDSLKTLSITDSVTMKLFLGCYCGDSKKWVPRFYDLKATLPISTVEIISVDTTKKDEKKLAQAVGLKKIPTFIFYQGGDEIGRIVEKPKGGLEKSLYGVLKKCSNKE